MRRFDIINYLINKNNYKTYLEIGVHDFFCFNKIICEQKTSVDPSINEFKYNFNIISDKFFEINNNKFDLIFIDGLHLAEQVEKDVENSLKVLNENGRIVLHDSNPSEELHAMEHHYVDAWNGTVWKTIQQIRSSREDLIVKTYPHDHGVTVIRKGYSSKIDILNKYFSFNVFYKNKDKILNFTENIDDL
jgi:hypothetical protein